MMAVDDPAVVAEVTAAFHAYEKALMGNDLAGLNGLFWDAPQTLRYGVGENLYGAEAIAEFRRSRPGGSPSRTLAKTVITTFGADFATANTEFQRAGVAKSGRQSQTWVRTDAGWKIASAHVSMIGDHS